MIVIADESVPRFHCVITGSDGVVIYTGRTTEPGEPFIGGHGETIAVNPNDYERIAEDAARMRR